MSSFASRNPELPRGNLIDDPPPMPVPVQQPPSTRHAEWGLASMFLAGFLGVLALLTLQICVLLFFGPPMWARVDLRAIFWVSILGVLLVLGMIGVAGASGIMSLIAAVKQKQPCALGLAGLLLSIFVLFFWIFVFIDLFCVLDFLMRRQGFGGAF